jgi:hydroxymethylglutaryl-CoA synthase
MGSNSVGISDIALYIPSQRVELETIVEKRVADDPALERRLRRALETTGQVAIRFPEIYQDTATLAAQAARKLITADPEFDPAGIRYLAVGTETSIDMSKPVAAYVEGMLQNSGVPVPTSLSTFQVQHACAGGTISLLSVAAMLNMSGRATDTGVVICSDIARYDAPSTAEITQGAGAVALRVERDPQLLHLDLSTVGYSSQDVDDFFRPLGSVTAKVKGGYSIQCYHEALEAAFLDHCDRRGEDPKEVLENTDMLVLHVPFMKMGFLGAERLVTKILGCGQEEANSYLAERGFPSSVNPTAEIGNIYTGSAYLALTFLLRDRYQVFGDDIVGKRVLFSSYGSGNTMSVFSATVADGAPEIISSWHLEHSLNGKRVSSIQEYEKWITTSSYKPAEATAPQGVHPGLYYLEGIREDGYRQYGYKPALIS